jgi:hypothetical protein
MQSLRNHQSSLLLSRNARLKNLTAFTYKPGDTKVLVVDAVNAL